MAAMGGEPHDSASICSINDFAGRQSIRARIAKGHSTVRDRTGVILLRLTGLRLVEPIGNVPLAECDARRP